MTCAIAGFQDQCLKPLGHTSCLVLLKTTAPCDDSALAPPRSSPLHRTCRSTARRMRREFPSHPLGHTSCLVLLKATAPCDDSALAPPRSSPLHRTCRSTARRMRREFPSHPLSHTSCLVLLKTTAPCDDSALAPPRSSPLHRTCRFVCGGTVSPTRPHLLLGPTQASRCRSLRRARRGGILHRRTSGPMTTKFLWLNCTL
jgi:hypothetical protein